MTELVLVEQLPSGAGDDGAHWILEGGEIRPGVDDGRRLAELRRGLLRHARVRAVEADVDGEEVEQTLSVLHEPAYLEALAEVGAEPLVIPELSPPGLPPDIPVSAGLVAAAREGVRTAIAAAGWILAGERFAYALCRPPGHHAGPAWCAGYCYLNAAAAAAQTLRQAGIGPLGILDLDFHYPNGTTAIVESMEDVAIASINAAPVTNLASNRIETSTDRELPIEFHIVPGVEEYMDSLSSLLRELDDFGAEALVVSLGYDVVAGDPHGSWDFGPEIFAEVGAALAGTGLPLCVVQEGGYALDRLADCSQSFAHGILDGAPVCFRCAFSRP